MSALEILHHPVKPAMPYPAESDEAPQVCATCRGKDGAPLLWPCLTAMAFGLHP